MNMKLSELKNQFLIYLNELIKDKEMLKGSLYKIKKNCGVKNCKKCNTGQYHEVYQFSFTSRNKVQTSTTITRNLLPQIKKRWDSYKNYRSNIKKIKKSYQQLMKELILLEKRQLIYIDEYKRNIGKSAKKSDS